MGTSQNKYTSFFPNNPTGEQELLADLVEEAINFNGVPVYYLPRNVSSSLDMVYGEAPGSYFNQAYKLTVYVENVGGFEGMGPMFAKFGYELRDSLNVSLGRRTFERFVENLFRPREGDLILIPAMNKMFEIKFVNQDKEFFILGRRAPLWFYYDLSLEAFKYSNERFITGVDDVDSFGNDYGYSIVLTLGSGAGNYTLGEKVYQESNSNTTCTAFVSQWIQPNNTLLLISIDGELTPNANLIGAISNANYIISTIDNQSFGAVRDEIADNSTLQTDISEILDLTEINNIGEP